MLTLNQHITLFSAFASDHMVIKSFDFGKLPDWGVSNKQDGEDLIYPAMFVMPISSGISGSELVRKYTVYFCERERKGADNENDGWSDCERLWFDFIAYMAKSLNDQPVAIDKSLTAEPFREWDVDYLVAYVGDFSLRESFDYNDCVIPLTSTFADVLWYNTTNILVVNNGVQIESSGGANLDFTVRNPYSQTVSASSVFNISFNIDSASLASDTFMGVAKTTKVANTYTDIDYTFYRDSANTMQVWELGVLKHTFVNATLTLTYQIISNGSSVKYYYGGVLVYTSLVAPSDEYKLKACFFNNTAVNGKVTNINI